MRNNPELLLQTVTRALYRLLEAAAPYKGLWPSVLDCATARMPSRLPPAANGQRESDRAFPGANLMHDHVTLQTMMGVGTALKQPELVAGAERYLSRFAGHCAQTPSGLFPWGEHTFWNLIDDRPGNSYLLQRGTAPLTHDHLLQAPQWLWRELWARNAGAVERFGHGLDIHWKAGEPPEYNRHALLRAPDSTSDSASAREPRSYDFPRHSGFYIGDWAFLYRQTGDAQWKTRIEKMLDYWWDKRDASNLLLTESRSPADFKYMYHVNSASQTLSLGISLLEAARVVASDTTLAQTLITRGWAYIHAFLSLPHDLESGRLILALSADDGEIRETATIWGSQYGTHAASAYALLCLYAYEDDYDERALEIARAIGRANVETLLPADTIVPAKDGGLALSLLVELHLNSDKDDKLWLDRAFALAERLIETYFDSDLPRGAAGVDWYESQFLPGHLLHALARLALVADKPTQQHLRADFTVR